MAQVSVIVTYYDSAPYDLRRCIDSILEQTFTDFELLVICNIFKMKEYWERIAADYEAIDSRVRFFSVDQKGASYARNFGISKCTGKYLSIIDGDDYVEPTFIKTLLKGMENSELSICGVEGRKYKVINSLVDKIVFFSLPSIYAKEQYINFSVNKMYVLDIIKEHSLSYPEDITLGEDAMFVASYLEHCSYIATFENGLYQYIYHPTSLTNNYDENYIEYEKRVIDTQYKMFSSQSLCDFERLCLYKWLYKKIFFVACYYLDRGEAKRAKEIFYMPELQLLIKDYKQYKRYLRFNTRIVIRGWGIGQLWPFLTSKEKKMLIAEV